MQLRKRFVNPEKEVNNPISEPQEILIDYQPDQGTIEEEQLPPLQPRREKHAKKKGITLFVFSAAFLSSVVLLAGWGTGWLKGQQVETAVPILSSETVKNPIAEKQVEKVTASPPNEGKPVEQPKASTPVQQSQPQNNPKPEVKKPVYKQIMKHRVEPGETLYRISIKYYHTGKYANYLTKYNGLRSPSDLVSGTYIRVPYPPN